MVLLICIQIVLFGNKWNPSKVPRISSGYRCLPLNTVLVVFQHILFLQNDMFSFPILNHAKGLQRAYNVIRINCHFLEIQSARREKKRRKFSHFVKKFKFLFWGFWCVFVSFSQYLSRA